MSATADIPGALRLATTEQLSAELERRSQIAGASLCIAAVVALVALETGVPAESITGERRTKSVALARQVAMFILRVRYGLSFAEIGSAFSRDHGTVIFAVSRIGTRRLQDAALSSLLQRLDNAVSALVQSLATGSQIYHFAAETGVSAPGSTRSAAPSCAPGNP